MKNTHKTSKHILSGTTSLKASKLLGGFTFVLPMIYTCVADAGIPETIDFSDKTGLKHHKVCVLGASMAGITADKTANVPAYYLTKSGNQGIWTEVPSNLGQPIDPSDPTKGTISQTVEALEILPSSTSGGIGIASVKVNPTTPNAPYINAASFKFYIINNPAPDFSCSTIKTTIIGVAGNREVNLYLYPFSLVEYTSDRDGNDKLIINISNVDSFQLPLNMSLSSQSTVMAEFGNPYNLPDITRKTMITGSKDNPEAPFTTWLKAQGDPALPPYFSHLTTTKKTHDYSMLLSPKDYLAEKCVPDAISGKLIPSTCSSNGATANYLNPLNTYFDQELTNFFKNAIKYSPPEPPLALKVMGDAKDEYPQQAWEVTDNKVNCPLYLKGDGKSLLLRGHKTVNSVDIPDEVILCNPVDSVVPLAGIKSTSNQLTAQDWKVITPQKNIFYLKTLAQYNQAKKHIGWNFVQPDTGFVGEIISVDPATQIPLTDAKGNLINNATRTVYPMTVNVVNKDQAAPTSPNQKQTLCSPPDQIACITPNMSMKLWAFSNIAAISGVRSGERSGEMVFANDGVFGSWQFYTGAKQIVFNSITRNISQAFSLGIANCNNVTMNPAASDITPPVCKDKVKPINVTASAKGSSSEYWSNEENFYPAGGIQNYYSQYLHTFQINGNNTFVTPNHQLTPIANSNQDIPMGMGYGYAYDENPSYVEGTPVAQVPAKMDPIPSAWNVDGIKITFGPWQ